MIEFFISHFYFIDIILLLVFFSTNIIFRDCLSTASTRYCGIRIRTLPCVSCFASQEPQTRAVFLRSFCFHCLPYARKRSFMFCLYGFDRESIFQANCCSESGFPKKTTELSPSLWSSFGSPSKLFPSSPILFLCLLIKMNFNTLP